MKITKMIKNSTEAYTWTKKLHRNFIPWIFLPNIWEIWTAIFYLPIHIYFKTSGEPMCCDTAVHRLQPTAHSSRPRISVRQKKWPVALACYMCLVSSSWDFVLLRTFQAHEWNIRIKQQHKCHPSLLTHEKIGFLPIHIFQKYWSANDPLGPI